MKHEHQARYLLSYFHTRLPHLNTCLWMSSPFHSIKRIPHHPTPHPRSYFKQMVSIQHCIRKKILGNALLCKSFPFQVVFHLSIHNTSVQDFLHNKFFRLCLFNFFTFAILFLSHFVLQKKFRLPLFVLLLQTVTSLAKSNFGQQTARNGVLIHTIARSSDSFHVSA